MVGNSILQKWVGISFRIVWSVQVPPTMEINSFGARGHVQKSRNHRNEGLESSHITEAKSHKFKLKQNNPTEFLSRSFP